MTARFIRPASVRKLCKDHNKRVSKSFLLGLDCFVQRKIESACRITPMGTLREEVFIVK